VSEQGASSLDALLATDPFEATFEAARVGLAIVDLEGRFLRVNLAYAELAGQPAEDLVGEPFTGDPDQLQAMVQGAAPRSCRFERLLREDVWVLQGVTLTNASDGRPAWFVVDAQDISDRRRAEDELAHRALHDELTGLPNRVLALDRLRQALAQARRAGTSVGALFCDLDGFKEVNDRHGHLLGDVVLQVVAHRLTGVVRPSDTVARLGGDEFVVVVGSPVTETEMFELARRVEAAVSVPLREHGTATRVGVSIGAVVSRTGIAQDTPEALLARADDAMYETKHAHRATRDGAA